MLSNEILYVITQNPLSHATTTTADIYPYLKPLTHTSLDLSQLFFGAVHLDIMRKSRNVRTSSVFKCPLVKVNEK